VRGWAAAAGLLLLLDRVLDLGRVAVDWTAKNWEKFGMNILFTTTICGRIDNQIKNKKFFWPKYKL
jgi:hypothetical protein